MRQYMYVSNIQAATMTYWKKWKGDLLSRGRPNGGEGSADASWDDEGDQFGPWTTSVNSPEPQPSLRSHLSLGRTGGRTGTDSAKQT